MFGCSDHHNLFFDKNFNGSTRCFPEGFANVSLRVACIFEFIAGVHDLVASESSVVKNNPCKTYPFFHTPLFFVYQSSKYLVS